MPGALDSWRLDDPLPSAIEHWNTMLLWIGDRQRSPGELPQGRRAETQSGRTAALQGGLKDIGPPIGVTIAPRRVDGLHACIAAQ